MQKSRNANSKHIFTPEVALFFQAFWGQGTEKQTNKKNTRHNWDAYMVHENLSPYLFPHL